MGGLNNGNPILHADMPHKEFVNAICVAKKGMRIAQHSQSPLFAAKQFAESNGVLDPQHFASHILRYFTSQLWSFGSSDLRILRIFDLPGGPGPLLPSAFAQ